MADDRIENLEKASQQLREVIDILKWECFTESERVLDNLREAEDIIDADIMNEA